MAHRPVAIAQSKAEVLGFLFQLSFLQELDSNRVVVSSAEHPLSSPLHFPQKG